jgi:hypothetical protein
VKRVVVALVGVFCLMTLGRALANISPETPISGDSNVHVDKPRDTCRLQVKLVCSLGLPHYRDCHKVKALICEVE